MTSKTSEKLLLSNEKNSINLNEKPKVRCKKKLEIKLILSYEPFSFICFSNLVGDRF